MAYVLVVMFVVFKVIDKTIGLRVPEQVEIEGLDIHEHGLASAYSGFSISDATYADMDVNENCDLGESDIDVASEAKVAAAVPVVRQSPDVAAALAVGMPSGIHRVTIIVQLGKFDALKRALNELGVTGMTVTQVMGCGVEKGAGERYRGVEIDATLLPKVKVDVVVGKVPVDDVVDTAKRVLYTGHIGDGKIFVYDVDRVVKVRTGEEGVAALQDVE
jgi:Amt family ammonium transporter